MEPNKPWSIFDSPNSRHCNPKPNKPSKSEVETRSAAAWSRSASSHNAHKHKHQSGLKSFIRNKEGYFELIPPEQKTWMGKRPDPNRYDIYDEMEHFQIFDNGVGPHLMHMISIQDYVSVSYDDLEIEMEALTEDRGVSKFVIQTGNGTKVPMDSTVWVQYIAFAEGSDNAIDAYSSREKMSSFDIGKGEILPGLLIAFQSMEVGEISRFLISPEYGYGKLGCPNLVAPNNRLLYAIKMIKFTVGPLETPVWKLSSKERRKLDFEIVFKAADDLREAGKQKIKLKQYQSALERYQKGLKILKDAWILEKKEQDQMWALKYTFHSNLAWCHLQLDEPILAVIACKAALGPDMPTPQAKLFYRYAVALLKLGKPEEAGKFCEKAEQLDRRDSKIQNLKIQIRIALAKEDKVKVELWKKMCPVARTTCTTTSTKEKGDHRE